MFIEAALAVGAKDIYTLHKTSTRDVSAARPLLLVEACNGTLTLQFLVKKFSRDGITVTPIAQLRFDLPQTYKFHKKKSVDVEVDLLHIAVPRSEEEVEESGETEPTDGAEDDKTVDASEEITEAAGGGGGGGGASA